MPVSTTPAGRREMLVLLAAPRRPRPGHRPAVRGGRPRGRADGLRRRGAVGQVSDLAAHTAAIRASLTETPVRTAAAARGRIEPLTGLRRKPTQVRVFLAGLGLKWRRVQAVPVPPERPPGPRPGPGGVPRRATEAPARSGGHREGARAVRGRRPLRVRDVPVRPVVDPEGVRPGRLRPPAVQRPRPSSGRRVNFPVAGRPGGFFRGSTGRCPNRYAPARSAHAACTRGPYPPRTSAGRAGQVTRPHRGHESRCRRYSVTCGRTGGISITWCRRGAGSSPASGWEQRPQVPARNSRTASGGRSARARLGCPG